MQRRGVKKHWWRRLAVFLLFCGLDLGIELRTRMVMIVAPEEYLRIFEAVPMCLLACRARPLTGLNPV